jgi:hypothetical protein
MRTAASRTSRSLVPRDQSNRSGLQGTRSALSVTAQRLGSCGLHLRSCTDGAYPHGACSVGHAGDGYNTLYLTKRTHPWRIRTRGSCYSRLLREANSLYAGSSTLGAPVWGGCNWPETCICVPRSGQANSLISEQRFGTRRRRREANSARRKGAEPRSANSLSRQGVGATVGRLTVAARGGAPQSLDSPPPHGEGRRGRSTHRLRTGRGAAVGQLTAAAGAGRRGRSTHRLGRGRGAASAN